MKKAELEFGKLLDLCLNHPEPEVEVVQESTEEGCELLYSYSINSCIYYKE